MFRARRGGADFDDWASFVKHYCDDLPPNGYSLCNVLVANDVPSDGGGGSRGGGFPWITPVVGTGAISDVDGLEPMSELVSRAVNSIPDSQERGLTADYAVALVAGRLGVDQRDLELDPAAVPDTSARELGALLHATVRLTTAYHAILSAGTPVVGHREIEAAVLSPMAAARPELEFEFVAPAMAATAVARERCTDEHLRRILHGAHERLKPDRHLASQVARADVRTMTEHCWATLVQSYYRGWSDLLWGLFMAGANYPPKHRDQGPRPLAMNLEDAADTVRSMLLDRTADSWSAASGIGLSGSAAAPDADGDGPSAWGRHDLQRHVASALATQSRYRNRIPFPKDRPPLASAFVTGFDLELELAMLRHEQSFVMAVPFEIDVDDHPQTGAIVWLGCFVPVVSGRQPLSAVLEPSSTNWFLLSGSTDADSLPVGEPSDSVTLGSVPCIVRLTGSPLVAVPDLDDARQLERGLADLLQTDPESIAGLRHAVLVDETVALSHTAAMLDGEHMRTNQSSGRSDFGLPADFIRSKPDRGFFRYWLLLGVQLSDAAVRHAITMQLAMRSARSSTIARTPISNGLAVNEHLSGAAEEALRKLGLDRVRGAVDLLNEEIAHYSEHLDQAGESDPAAPRLRRANRGRSGRTILGFPSRGNDRCSLRART